VTIGTATDASGADYLVGPDGFALYTNDNDSATSSSCTGGCAANWPALAVDPGATIDAPGVTGTFTTLSRTDGSTQLVYNGSPLYNFVGDSAAGDTNGDGIGGVWHLARPQARARRLRLAAGSTPRRVTRSPVTARPGP
jgi:predicted lipoprotein with Yx(FWY)xxD motif